MDARDSFLDLTDDDDDAETKEARDDANACCVHSSLLRSSSLLYLASSQPLVYRLLISIISHLSSDSCLAISSDDDDDDAGTPPNGVVVTPDDADDDRDLVVISGFWANLMHVRASHLRLSLALRTVDTLAFWWHALHLPQGGFLHSVQCPQAFCLTQLWMKLMTGSGAILRKSSSARTSDCLANGTVVFRFVDSLGSTLAANDLRLRGAASNLPKKILISEFI